MDFICTDSFISFYRKLNSVTDANIFFRDVQNALNYIAPELSIAKVTCDIVIDPHYRKLSGNDSTNVLYVSPFGECDNENVVTYVTGTASVGEATYRAYPLTENGGWDKFQKDNILFILQIIHIAASRVKLTDNIHTSLTTDELTGINNHSVLTASIYKQISKGDIGKFCCAFMNVKRFKHYNNEYSFGVGNHIMTRIANTLSNFCETDEVVCRTGGDNFILLFKKSRREIWLELLGGIPMEILVKGKMKKLLIQFHIGLYSATGEEKRDNELIESANAAYTIAKNIKKVDLLEYTDEVRELFIHRNEVLSNYQPAMVNGDMLVYYQPKVDLTTYRLVGAEALSRWNYHGKVMSPYWYIPILEHNSAICELDMYNLDTVCNNIREWIDSGLEPVRVSINFSRRHLENPDLVKDITDIIRKYNVPKELIEIEVTETVDNAEYQALMNFISDLHTHELMVSIDDFGTGVSSLNILKDVPVDIIKLDRSFLTDTQFKEKLSIVISDLVKMASDLNIKTLAEGVETKEQADFLRQINCNTAQGYYFDKPLPHDDFIEVLRRGGYEK